MITAMMKLMEDVGVDTDSEVSRLYLEMERTQILRAFQKGHESDGLMEAIDYYHNTYGSNPHAPTDSQVD